MNASVQNHLHAAAVAEAVATASRYIAPSWPLDRLIAVNPCWGLVDRPFAEVAHELACLGGVRLHMDADYYSAAWHSGRVAREHVLAALREAGIADSPEALVLRLQLAATDAPMLPLLHDILDARRDLVHEPAWRDTVTHQIGQVCAAWFDHDQAQWHANQDLGLFAAWRQSLAHDHGLSLLMHAPEVPARAAALPDDAVTMIEEGLQRLGVPQSRYADWLASLLLHSNGWAAWCAYQDRDKGEGPGLLQELMAIRLGWECVLDDGERGPDSVWAHWFGSWSGPLPCPSVMLPDWAVWQRALELAWERPLAARLRERLPKEAPAARPDVQAVFCIDVRSEVFRRALEAVAPAVQTMGFAGFFGLPIAYTPLGTDASRPQLPGPFTAVYGVSDSSGDAAADARIAQSRQKRLARQAGWLPFNRAPGSAFTMVETLGLGAIASLLRSSFWPSAARGTDSVGLSPAERKRLRPQLQLSRSHDLNTLVDLAEQVMRVLCLGDLPARLVVLIGHGSQSRNNAQAAGLDCGACCGQTGEVNARTLAELLNNRAVRRGLAERGISLPASSWVLAGLHNTTLDQVELFHVEHVPESHAQDVQQFAQALQQAGARARAERAPRLGLDSSDAGRLLDALRERANHWAETRPEFALAGNASFIIAPRYRSRDMDLGGRVFLQDYQWQEDRDFSVLRQLLTGPMVVAHWINFQYYASMVDNRHFGSGNKLLHNVVGSHIGVFEGNGGDLRIGLALQSLHDGERWVHEPLRLSVFVEAPSAAIAAVVRAEPTVENLVEQGWLHLYCLDAQLREVLQWRCGSWHPLQVAPAVPE